MIFSLSKFRIFDIMRTITLNIPDNVELDSAELSMHLASRLYEQGKLSLGQAAQIAGLTKRTFTELLGRYKVSVFNYPAADLDSDIDNA